MLHKFIDKYLNNNPISLWVLIFIIMTFVARGLGGTNAKARYASLQAVVDQHTFSIDSYKNWTIDWSSSPSHKIYSNKLPGGLFLTLPIYFLFDRLTKLNGNRKYIKNGIVAREISSTPKVFFNFLTKVLPFAILILILTTQLNNQGYSKASIHFFAISSLFGTTPALLMNAFFGHGLASILFISMFYFLLKKNYKLVGFFYGMTLLTDFSAGVLLPILLIFLIFKNLKNKQNIFNFIIGGIPPALLWSWYHYECYNSIFLTSINFPNPVFTYTKNITQKGMSMFSIFPKFKIIIKLLFGMERGILFTQPWVLLSTIFAIFTIHKNKFYSSFIITSLLTLILFNSTFQGWHGGDTIGPRYLSIILALMPFVVVFTYNNLSQLNKILLWAGLAISIVFRIQVYATGILPPVENLWLWQWSQISHLSTSYIALRIILPTLFFSFTSFYYFIKYKKVPVSLSKNVYNHKKQSN